jgi:hypothetical protein
MSCGSTVLRTDRHYGENSRFAHAHTGNDNTPVSV